MGPLPVMAGVLAVLSIVMAGRAMRTEVGSVEPGAEGSSERRPLV